MQRSRTGLRASLLFALAFGSCASNPVGPTTTPVPAAPAATVPVSTGSLPPPRPELPGFSPEAAANQRALESRFDELVNATNLDAWMKQLTAHPHHVGSPHDRANVEFIAALFREWGYETEIVQYDVLFPTPKKRQLELLGDSPYRAKLREPVLLRDAVSRLRRERLPPYNAYSADGNVTAPLVYVNYGVQEDYEQLARLGVDVAGKIVIARYGKAWRGIKPKLAAAHGALGCIIYSDPQDDGYVQGLEYPDGAFRHPESVQRGSVYDLPLRVGDPLTPYAASVPGTERLSREQAETLPTIPVLPIAWRDAQPLLAALEGPVAPPEWRGGLPLTYRVGASKAKVRLVVESNWDTVPAYNVIAKLRGRERPDQWIIRGNHHDAWVAGAADPISGLVALLEEARVVGELARTGQPPRRTVVYAAWGAEEPGIIGSTEWVEHHADLLRQAGALYINSDSNGRGFLFAGGSHALTDFVDAASNTVTDPQTGRSVADRLRAKWAVSDDAAARTKAEAHALPLSALGSGSDYSPFLQHLGVSSLNLGFGGENEGGSYHSVFDSYEHFVQFGDPGFVYGATLAKLVGRVTLRAANGDVLPFRFTVLARTIHEYVDELAQMVSSRREQAERINRLLDTGSFALAADPRQAHTPPKRRGAVPDVAFTRLRESTEALRLAAERFDEAVNATLAQPNIDPAILHDIDTAMIAAERQLTDADGLPERPWYRHLIYAPGLFTGYGVKTLPGVREAIEAENWTLAGQQIERAALAVGRLARLLDDTAAGVAARMRR